MQAPQVVLVLVKFTVITFLPLSRVRRCRQLSYPNFPRTDMRETLVDEQMRIDDFRRPKFVKNSVGRKMAFDVIDAGHDARVTGEKPIADALHLAAKL